MSTSPIRFGTMIKALDVVHRMMALCNAAGAFSGTHWSHDTLSASGVQVRIVLRYERGGAARIITHREPLAIPPATTMQEAAGRIAELARQAAELLAQADAWCGVTFNLPMMDDLGERHHGVIRVDGHALGQPAAVAL